MRKNFIKTMFMAAFTIITISATGLTAQAAEATTETATETQDSKVTLTAASKAALKTMFDAKYYAEAYPDVVAVVGDSEDALFAHYSEFGIIEGRDASATFNVSFYALANPDIVAVYGDDMNGYIDHYVNFGVKENRIASNAALAAADVKTQQAVIATINSVQTASAASVGTTQNSGGSSFVPSFVRPTTGTIVTNIITGETHAIGDSWYAGNGWTSEATDNGIFRTFNARDYDRETGSNTIDRVQAQIREQNANQSEGKHSHDLIYIDHSTGYSVTIGADSITDSNGNTLSNEEAYDIVT